MASRICQDCGHGPLDLRGCWHEITGYEKDRAQGGTNAVAERKRTGSILCDSCMHKRKLGIASGQGTFG